MLEKIEEKSFSLGRLDIVDLYEWHTNKKLQYQTYFQRQSVWRDKDKVELIDTIMKGLPIPAIFICDAQTNFESLSKTYNVLDGRQRLESIFSFLNGEFKYNEKTFAEMEASEKSKILNYNIALVQMYLQPDDTNKIKEIFKRLNKNSYNLNKIEKQSTQMVEYDYIIIGKIATGMIQFENVENYMNEINELFSEEDDSAEIGTNNLGIKEGDEITGRIKEICEMIINVKAIFSSDLVFSRYEYQRQISLQYFLNIYAAVINEEVLGRNVSEKQIIELSDYPLDILKEKMHLLNSVSLVLIELYQLDIHVFWKNKSSFYTLITLFANYYSQMHDMLVDDIKRKLNDFYGSASKELDEYLFHSKQGVNDKSARIRRSEILYSILFN